MAKKNVEQVQVGKGMSDGVAQKYSLFTEGNWTSAAPRKAGRYMIAGVDGEVLGEVEVTKVEKVVTMTLPHGRSGTQPVTDFQGWWWSVQCPPALPKAGKRKLPKA